jgi:hypothetical protein
MKPRRQKNRPPSLLIALLILAAAAVGAGSDDESFGSGIFGNWITDPDGIPAYNYTMRSDDPRSLWDPRVGPKTNLQWHQLGNQRLNANAYNLGMVKLFFGEAGLMWLNEYEPEKGEHCGGFGWLLDGNTVLIDRDDFVPPRAKWERVFGVGYFRKRMEVGGLRLERKIVAPAGDFPALVSIVSVENRSDRPRDLQLIEYWDANMRLIPGVQPQAGLEDNLRDRRLRLVLDRGLNLLRAVAGAGPAEDESNPRPRAVARRLPDLFLYALEPPAAWIVNPNELFDRGRLRQDAAALARAGTPDPAAGPRSQRRLCLAARMRFALAPGERREFKFVYGYTTGESPSAFLLSIPDLKDERATPAVWQKAMPALDLPGARFLERELKWDYYYFLSAGLYDRYYQRHHLPQGANYLYYTGINGATRDYSAFVQTLSYYQPALAREALEFMMRAQEPSGRLFYDLEGFGKRYSIPYRPGDLDIWFLGALSDYVLLTRDFAFLDREVPYYPLHQGKKGTVWEHARRSFRHLVDEVGVGEHGHPRLRLSDWNDEMTFLTAGNPLNVVATFNRGESVMNTALALAFLPRFQALASARDDVVLVTEVENYTGVLMASLNAAWSNDHFIRSYDGRGRPFGQDRVFLEPQAFALLAAPQFDDGSPFLNAGRREILLRTLRERLSAPSKLGMLIANDSTDTLTTRKGEQEEGGIWLAINIPALEGISAYDPKMAWQELLRNTLAHHADIYPEIWYGIWSGPDAWNASTSDRPGETWYMKSAILNTGPQMYPVQNAHSHCQIMHALAFLAGVRPSAGGEGWTVDPRIPAREYAFACALYSLKVGPDRIGGAVRLPVTAPLRLKVKLPPELDPEMLVVTVEGQEVEASFEGEFAVFTLPARAGAAVAWEVGPGY